MKKANNKSLLSCLFSVLMLTLTLSIMNPVTAEAAVKLNKTEASVKVGKTTKLKIKGAKGAKVKWSSSKKKIATVSNKGVVTGKKPGKTTIKAKVGGKTYKCQLSVFCKRHKYVETTIPATSEHGAYKCKKCKVCGYETDKEEIVQLTEAEAQAKIMALKSQYPDGTPWGMDKTYFWEATNERCVACGAFAALLQDTVFGVTAPIRRHNNLYDIKIGDVVGYVGPAGPHAGIVIARNGDIVTTADGNVGGTVAWGRQYKITSATILASWLQQSDTEFVPVGSYPLKWIATRYE
ncbi:Ig-like domain-containing protein [Butyrivibrio sp. WCD3002]|uniref:Ig-like domain-containing protein n=1 Tax=Butyrivibrio sp. WCD3002 TaxID=1280676 RepID=UPI00041F8FA6|nr:Ig-like domain-containing protein [Butyrivibrio sp. WCD3002]